MLKQQQAAFLGSFNESKQTKEKKYFSIELPFRQWSNISHFQHGINVKVDVLEPVELVSN